MFINRNLTSMKKISILLMFVLGVIAAQAQTQTLVLGSSISPQTGCDFNLYDSGGENGNYFANRDDHITLISNQSNHGAVEVAIPLDMFNVHPSDTVFIYDGPNVNDSMLLAVLNDSLVAVYGNVTLHYAATIRTNGELTVRFKTDGSGEGTGFRMLVGCVQLCQRVNIQYDFAASTKYPILDPTDGYFYMDVCPYDTVRLVVRGSYPDNNFNYTQSDATSLFRWSMTDTLIETVGGNVLNYNFEAGAGYDVTLTIVDNHGCESANPKVFRVRTSANPIREVVGLPEVCTGQPLDISVGYDMISHIQIDTVSQQMTTTLAVADTIFLPDGVECNGTCSYLSPVTFEDFASSAKITSPNDILYVRLAIEHSWIGDIYIRLVCPNGQYATIMKYGGSGSTSCLSSIPSADRGWQGTPGPTSSYFGLYYEPDGTDKCNASQSPIGTCWNYCWSNNTAQGYQYACGNGWVYESCNHISANNPHGTSSPYVDSTNVANMTNVYHPDDNFFQKLQNCPLNGQWAIEVFDAWGSDNGYVCGWELALNPNLVPQDWSYDVVLDSVYITGPGAEHGTIIPTEAGDVDYVAHVVDNLGCVYDTTMVLHVTQSPQPDLGEDLVQCYGVKSVLDPHFEVDNTTYTWNTGDTSQILEVMSAGQYILVMETSNDASTLTCRGTDTINISFYPMPLFDWEANVVEGCAPMTVKMLNRTTPDSSEYRWRILDETAHTILYSNQKEPVFHLDEPGVYSVQLICYTADGCSDSVLRWNYLHVNAQPVAEFTPDPERSLMGETGGLVHFASFTDSTFLDGGLSSVHWSFGDGETDSVNLSPDHTYSQWGDYDVTLRLESGTGCSSEVTHTVVIEQDLIFPNIITPNGDGSNDVFAIENLNTDINPEDPDGYRNNKLIIYDRWGKKVYEAKNYDTFSRDGQIQPGTQIFDASGVSDGVYYFTFYYKGKAKTITYNGSLTIIR